MHSEKLEVIKRLDIFSKQINKIIFDEHISPLDDSHV